MTIDELINNDRCIIAKHFNQLTNEFNEILYLLTSLVIIIKTLAWVDEATERTDRTSTIYFASLVFLLSQLLLVVIKRLLH